MPAAPRVIRDKEFAKRLEISCENHHLSPSGHGRQKWLRDQILDKFSVRLSPEAVRKWFAGEARPRPNVMRQIAQVLEVERGKKGFAANDPIIRRSGWRCSQKARQLVVVKSL